MYGFDFSTVFRLVQVPRRNPVGPKSSLHRVLSDGHVVRVLLAHQECFLYGRVHWVGPDLQIKGRGEVASGLSLGGAHLDPPLE